MAALEEAVRKGWTDEKDVSTQILDRFLSGRGKAFYKIADLDIREERRRIVLKKGKERIPDVISNIEKTVQIVPFKSGDGIISLRWTES